MILIADSGSTKTDWAYIEKQRQVKSFVTKGFNPMYHSQEFIIDGCKRDEGLMTISSKVERLYYYGAGCSSADRCHLVKNALQQIFINAVIVIEHDLQGAAISVCRNNAGFVGILGTGSNFCYFDGREVSPVKHGLGYVLGDEGSGTFFGKRLLSRYLYGIMPVEIANKFNEKYNINRDEVLNSVYRSPNPGAYLASFTPFISENIHHKYMKDLVKKGFTDFFETNVISYPEHQKHPMHFVGSVASVFKSFILEVADQYGVQIGNILKSPIEGLTEYYSNK